MSTKSHWNLDLTESGISELEESDYVMITNVMMTNVMMSTEYIDMLQHLSVLLQLFYYMTPWLLQPLSDTESTVRQNPKTLKPQTLRTGAGIS